jgi:ABC-2 type transport system permease protein
MSGKKSYLISHQTFALARKELYSFAISPAFYGIALFFLLFTSIWFFYMQTFFSRDVASLRSYFSAFPLVFAVVIPALTMKSWAEERKIGSYELLLTMPFSEWGLVFAKFLATAGAILAFLVLTIPLPLSLAPIGRFDAGVIFCEYFGALLLGLSSAAVGLFMSSLSKNQAGAFLASAAVLLVMMFINQIPLVSAVSGPVNAFIFFISLSNHFESFSKGLLDSRDLLFFLTACVLFLTLNTQVLLFRKWR